MSSCESAEEGSGKTKLPSSIRMEKVKKDALMAVHRTMMVLREEIEMKNRIIWKLRKQISRRKVCKEDQIRN